jgi:hypothetical protein
VCKITVCDFYPVGRADSNLFLSQEIEIGFEQEIGLNLPCPLGCPQGVPIATRWLNGVPIAYAYFQAALVASSSGASGLGLRRAAIILILLLAYVLYNLLMM